MAKNQKQKFRPRNGKFRKENAPPVALLSAKASQRFEFVCLALMTYRPHFMKQREHGTVNVLHIAPLMYLQ